EKVKGQNRFDRGIRTVLIELASNVLLAAGKVIAGILGHSNALLADGIESTLDIFTSVVVLGGIKISAKPADDNHPYGHGKAETLAAMSVSMMVLLAACGIAVKSTFDLMHPHPAPAAF